MAGKTRVDGTTYEIKGGKTRVDGTTYEIKSGKTRIDGTTYNITFSSGKTLTISGTGGSYAMTYINNYGEGDGTYTLQDSDVVKVYVGSNSTSYGASCRVYLNGSGVKSGSGYYTLNISSYKTINIKFTEYTVGAFDFYYHCNITTT